MYFWVVDYKTRKDGKLAPVIIGGRAFTREMSAQKYIDDANLSQRAEIFELTTGNSSRATQMVKAKLIKRYKSLEAGTVRAVHNVR